MSHDASAELLEIENQISKLQDKIENLEDIIDQKDDEVSRIKKGTFESHESYLERYERSEMAFLKFRNEKNAYIKEMKQEISDLEARKKQLNEELFGGLDESDDF